MMNARAVQICGRGGVEVLALGHTPVRDPSHGEILVNISASGLNRADILQRRGLYPAPPGTVADVPGLEYSGMVAAVGDGVDAFGIGDRVMGIVAGGGMASHIVVHEREAIRVPDSISLIDAAAIPEAFLTAYDALFLQAGLSAGQRVLIHAIGSGIGTAALQLAQVAGAHVIGTSRTSTKLEACKRLGLTDGIVVKDARFAASIARFTGGKLADVILDLVGAEYLHENVAAVAPRGTIMLLGLLGGAAGELPLAVMIAKRVRVIGSVLRSRSLEEKAALAQSFAHHVLPLFRRGVLKPVVDAVLPLDQVAAAHVRMEANENVGKIVLRW